MSEAASLRHAAAQAVPRARALLAWLAPWALAVALGALAAVLWFDRLPAWSAERDARVAAAERQQRLDQRRAARERRVQAVARARAWPQRLPDARLREARLRALLRAAEAHGVRDLQLGQQALADAGDGSRRWRLVLQGRGPYAALRALAAQALAGDDGLALAQWTLQRADDAAADAAPAAAGGRSPVVDGARPLADGGALLATWDWVLYERADATGTAEGAVP